MSQPPPNPKIYHITHLDNLPSIISDRELKSEAAMINRGGPQTAIGMSPIKNRRLSLPVGCHSGSHVGDYVPFYFCPRSIMLYVIYRQNHPDLRYRGGQVPIVHLEADIRKVVAWASQMEAKWAFSLTNAGAVYTEFRSRLEALCEIDWDAVAAENFTKEEVKEAKQAEFLVYGAFPWSLVDRIGVASQVIEFQVETALANAAHKPVVQIQPNWYY